MNVNSENHVYEHQITNNVADWEGADKKILGGGSFV